MSVSAEINTNADQKSHFQAVFSSSYLRNEFRTFLDNIFLQLDSDKFFTLIDDIITPKKTDDKIYLELSNRIGEAKASALKTSYRALQSLSQQKVVLTDQMTELLGKGHKINGLVEIGFPGRFVRPMQRAFDISGRITALHPEEGLTDHIQAGGLRPYQQFIPLNDYEPLHKGQLKSNSVDVVTCFIGLHHVPKDKQKDYIQSIHRVLRPGGAFILRDHDSNEEKMTSLISVVHSVFNAATGVTPKEEKAELRNFQPIKDWYKTLEENGFKRVSGPLIRNNDPTKNSLVRFVKVQLPEDKKLAEVEDSLKTEPDYERKLMQTYLTAPEWRNVEMAQEYAAFLKEGKPFYQFPYFKQIQTFWQVFANSYKAARRQHSFSEVVTSEYMMMNLFIGISTTLEFLGKGMISLPFSWLKGESQTSVQQCISNIMDEYAKFIEHTPFYNFSYFSQIKPLWNAFIHSQTERTFVDFLTVFVGSIEMMARGIVSMPVAGVYNAPQNQESDSIQLLVSDPEDRIQGIKDRIVVKRTFTNSSYKLLEIPRYRPFCDIIQKLSGVVKLVKIAGQELIQVKVSLIKEQKEAILKNLAGCRTLYSYPNYQDSKREYVELEVDVDSLKPVMSALKERGAAIAYVHDF